MPSSGYIHDCYVIDSIQWGHPCSAGPIESTSTSILPPFHPAHKAGMGISILGLIILILGAGFVGCSFYTHKTKPFQFHYLKEDEDVNPPESSPNISNPVYDALPVTKEQTPTVSESNEEDKHQMISSGSYDLLQDS
ncbi:hypothetical protein Q8A67_012773 [Cirrhinus molitorella]|uniref:Uncharacterized protein n=1 Tax=Cirrhinus molitorella TaxID=172907 RepID=A0AA88TK60_9TELE|nr:hypothetical protein Q8A67_012773 [Cirrhinus molitorella]